MAGRPRKPTHLKVVAGTDQPCRTNKAEPKPARERPSPPSWISDHAKTAWGEACVILDGMKVLTRADVFAMVGLCEAIADLRKYREALAQDAVLPDGNGGSVVIAKGGEPTYVSVGKSGALMKARPEVAMIADADRRLAMWLSRFGLTPADRTRVSTLGGGKPADEWEGFD